MNTQRAQDWMGRLHNQYRVLLMEKWEEVVPEDRLLGATNTELFKRVIDQIASLPAFLILPAVLALTGLSCRESLECQIGLLKLAFQAGVVAGMSQEIPS